VASEESDQLALERIVFFSDAVIAIAITLLALEIRLPELTSGDDVAAALTGLGSHYFSFVVSFLVVGAYWLGHHRMFRVVRRFDDTLIRLNILFLLCVAFVPFASSVIGEHGDTRPAAVFYSLVIAACGIAELTVWMYASHRHRLIDDAFPPAAVRSTTRRMLLAPVVFLLALPLTLIHPYVAMVAWLAAFPLSFAMRRIEHRQHPA
jgi:uncharacterized membrane protein